MDDPGGVRLGQSFRDLRADLDNGGDWLWPSRGHELAQRGAIHPLHRDVRPGTVHADVVDRDDVGMIQGGSGTGFALESLDAIGIRGEVLPQHLDRHDASEPLVAGAIDLAHAAATERLEDLVRSEARAGVKSHPSGQKRNGPPESKSKTSSRIGTWTSTGSPGRQVKEGKGVSSCA